MTNRSSRGEARSALPGCSIFKAMNNRDKNFTRAKMKRRLTQPRPVSSVISLNWTKLTDPPRLKTPVPSKTKVATLGEEIERLKKLEARMLEAPHQQLSQTDPDARSMNYRGARICG